MKIISMIQSMYYIRLATLNDYNMAYGISNQANYPEDYFILLAE